MTEIGWGLCDIYFNGHNAFETPKMSSEVSEGQIFLRYSVHARKKLVHRRQFARMLLSARTIDLTYLELHLRSKICASEIQRFLAENTEFSGVIGQVAQPVPLA